MNLQSTLLQNQLQNKVAGDIRIFQNYDFTQFNERINIQQQLFIFKCFEQIKKPDNILIYGSKIKLCKKRQTESIEQQIQEQLVVQQSFNSNPDDRKLHLRHVFSQSKCDFIARFKRFQGQNVLLPFAFLCTTSDAAKKPQRDLDILQKGGKLPNRSQYQSLLQVGIKQEEIPKFTDPYYWIRFFPSLVKEDLISFGCSVDWRRSFITTDENLYFNSFIEWHLTKLKEAGYIKFGKKPSICSTSDNQLCVDFDRGEGAGNQQEYTLIKQRVLKPEFINSLTKKNVFLVSATLSPQTLYGQTNLFVLPEVNMEYSK
ncbi:unnamed protein product [Paramecium sonneborni]|uniref:Uncharacterized protein n=1 Tax=Paramecium sonneborni TaxID=65129 RepID=A0A8S1RQM1_9CILI|nr:unnamed protein product [Paramecium sonneborni]